MPAAVAGRRCRQRLADHLAAIPTMYARLDATPGSAGSNGGRGAPGFSSRSPARDDVLVLTDTRAVAHDPEQPRNASGTLPVLAWWADQAREAGLVEPLPEPVRGRRWIERTVAGEAGALAGALARLVEWWQFGELLAAVAAAAGHLTRALHEHEQTVPLGSCPRPAPGVALLLVALVEALDADSASGPPVPRCGGEVRARAFGESASCRRCRYRWEGLDEVRELGAQLGDAMLDLPGLSRYLGVESLSTLRSWARRDGWQRERAGGRTLYRLEDARASALAAWDRRHPVYGCEPPPVQGCATPPGWVRFTREWGPLVLADDEP